MVRNWRNFTKRRIVAYLVSSADRPNLIQIADRVHLFSLYTWVSRGLRVNGQRFNPKGRTKKIG